MSSKKKLLKNSRLYIIIDKGVLKEKSLIPAAQKIRQAGAQVIQLRDKCRDKQALLKDALELEGFLSESDTIFIINDYIDIPMLAGADGVHLGQEDLSVEAA